MSTNIGEFILADNLDSNKKLEVCFLLPYYSINKEEAKELIAHLNKVFELGKEDD